MKTKDDKLQKRDELMEVIDQGIDNMRNSEDYKKYLKTMAKFHSYSFNNILLIMNQMPEATRVAGYVSWQKNFKRHVKKGEKALTIFAPCTYKQEVKLDDGSMELRTYQTFKMASVFDISQTEGEKLPTLCEELQGRVDGYKVLLEASIKTAGIPVSFENIGTGAKGYYQTVENSIVVKENMSEIQTMKTLFHELAHSRLHQGHSELSREAKEVEAESVAFVVASHFNIDTSEYSFGYLALWASQDKKEIRESAKRIQKCSDQMIRDIEDYLNQDSKDEQIYCGEKN